MKAIRMLGSLAFAVALTLVIGVLAPQQLPVTLYKLSLIVTAAVIGYWIDRELFPYSRPDQCGANHVNSAMLRRAIVIAACIVGVALGA